MMQFLPIKKPESINSYLKDFFTNHGGAMVEKRDEIGGICFI